MANRALVMTKPRLCKIDTITFDVCLEESHSLVNVVTDHSTEEGANISDHVRPEADRVQLRLFISNTPLSDEQKTRSVQEGSVKFTSTSAQDVQIGAVDGRGADAFRKLKKLRDEGTMIKVVTTLRTYPEKDSTTEGMVIESMTIPRTSKNYDGLEATVQLKQIRIVKNQSTRDVQSKDPRTKPRGHQGAKPDKDPKDADRAPLVVAAEKMSSSDNGVIKGLGNFALGGGSGGASQ